MLNINLIEKLKISLGFSKRKQDKRSAGVIDEGENGVYMNCAGEGPDAGLINKGKGTKVINSDWSATRKK